MQNNICEQLEPNENVISGACIRMFMEILVQIQVSFFLLQHVVLFGYFYVLIISLFYFLYMCWFKFINIAINPYYILFMNFNLVQWISL